MIYTGFYIIAALFIIKKFSNISKINLGIIMGLMVPDLGIFLKYLNLYQDYHGTIFHSIIFALFLFALLLIISEFKNKIIEKKIANGIFMGVLIHICLDLVIANDQILFYWPLPIEAINPLLKFELQYELLYILSCFQFIVLRYFGHRLNDVIIKYKHINKNSCKNINIISRWMQYQSMLFIVFLLMFFMNIKFSMQMIEFCIFSSLLIALYFSYNVKVIFNKEKIIEP